jgi:hypothetical protein
MNKVKRKTKSLTVDVSGKVGVLAYNLDDAQSNLEMSAATDVNKILNAIHKFDDKLRMIIKYGPDSDSVLSLLGDKEDMQHNAATVRALLHNILIDEEVDQHLI